MWRFGSLDVPASNPIPVESIVKESDPSTIASTDDDFRLNPVLTSGIDARFGAADVPAPNLNCAVHVT